MSQRNCKEMLKAKWAEKKFVCVGLDSELSKIPKSCGESIVRFPDKDPNKELIVYNNNCLTFNCAIVDETRDLVCAYKPNIAFYEANGLKGMQTLAFTINYIHKTAPSVPVILDAKRADIGNTNEGYVKMAFDWLQADAITVHPYLGAEALAPFLARKDKGIFVLCRTSNPGAGEFQDMEVCPREQKMPLYQYVAYQVMKNWNKNGNCGLVVGATYPNELNEVRKLVGDMPILIPGVGAQGGDLPASVKAAKHSFMVNSSRGILYASSGPDFAEAARRETQKLHNSINQYC